MTDKERLEEIKEQLKYLHGDSLKDDIGWLIQQVERVQELEETNKKNYWIASDFKFENLKLEQQNKRYRESIKKAISHFNYDEHQQGMAKLQKSLEELE